MALGLVAGACSSSSGDEAETEDSVVEAETDDTVAEAETDDTVAEAETDDTVEVVQSEGGKLAAVQAAGVLRCGGNETLPGFGIVDSEGEYSGFDVDFCRVVAAAVLGDADAVDLVPLNADARFPSLQSGDVDV
ncbi:MAG: general L-amino acid transport system substrate-binding protein, partial [Ilumatobacter sp.]